jgi:hypothetical protein
MIDEGPPSSCLKLRRKKLAGLVDLTGRQRFADDVHLSVSGTSQRYIYQNIASAIDIVDWK